MCGSEARSSQWPVLPRPATAIWVGPCQVRVELILVELAQEALLRGADQGKPDGPRGVGVGGRG